MADVVETAVVVVPVASVTPAVVGIVRPSDVVLIVVVVTPPTAVVGVIPVIPPVVVVSPLAVDVTVEVSDVVVVGTGVVSPLTVVTAVVVSSVEAVLVVGAPLAPSEKTTKIQSTDISFMIAFSLVNESVYRAGRKFIPSPELSNTGWCHFQGRIGRTNHFNVEFIILFSF